MNELWSQRLDLPDLWQQEGVRHLRAGHDVLIDAPTGAGKTRIFELYVNHGHLRNGRQAVYTVPTRALANDKWSQWKEETDWDVGIATGDLAINLTAPVIVATLETQRERFLAKEGPALLVIDEYQMISDRDRGLHYELALALAPPLTQLLLLSGSVANPERMAEWLRGFGRRVEIVSTKDRPVPLDDVPLLSLPYQAPRSVKGYWPRLAAEVLLADMGPLLIFVPHRQGSEKIARQIAESLPVAEPLELSSTQEELCDKVLKKTLAKRVAYHHSGLPYELRAGLIEPLARSGQLRVIVATMGLAAGINFSVRSVYVAENSFYEGPYLRQLQPDELLQMFGRAGRRGKDDCGFVIYSDKNPRLSDAYPARLRRANEVDWPTLIRIMHLAASQGESPFEAASRFCRSLFSLQPIWLGIEADQPIASTPADRPPTSESDFGLYPTRREILNSRGIWETYNPESTCKASYNDLRIRVGDSWKRACRHGAFVLELSRLGRLKRVRSGKDWHWGKQLVLANRAGEDDWKLTKGVANKLPKRFRAPLSLRDSVQDEILGRLEAKLGGGRWGPPTIKGDRLTVDIDFTPLAFSAYRDTHGALLHQAPERLTRVETNTEITLDSDPSRVSQPAARSPVYAWRSLGLIEPDGTPTRRGLIFSFFYHGEGLAVAAGLESLGYDLDDLVWDLANLRGGHRFSSLALQASGQLAHACRALYGPVNHEGYLRLGLPLQFGEGTGEALRLFLQQKRLPASEEVSRGDLERAVREWMSLLRHLAKAPDVSWDRWTRFQERVRATLRWLDTVVTPPVMARNRLNARQRQTYQRHRLHLRDFR